VRGSVVGVREGAEEAGPRRAAQVSRPSRRCAGPLGSPSPPRRDPPRQKLFDVLDFLKVPRRKLVSRHVKIHTKPLSESIENWDEVYSTLNGTQYESFLTSDYTI